MKTNKKLFILSLVVIAFFAFVGNANALNINQTNVYVNQGQSQTIYASNYSSYLYVSNNYNNAVANVSISGSAITIYGSSVGSTTATICDSNSSYNCVSIYITVNYNGYNNGNYNYNNGSLGLNISNIILSLGSSATISSSNNNYSGPGLYVSSNSNPSVASVSGSSSITGCTSTSFYSIVTGQPCNNNYSPYYNNYSTSYIPGCYGGSLYSVITGQLCSNYYNNNSFYNSSNNYNNGSLVISALSAGSDTITLCQNSGGNACSTINITVTGYATPTNYSYYYSYTPTNYPTFYNNPVSSYTSYNDYGIPIIYSTSTAY